MHAHVRAKYSRLKKAKVVNVIALLDVKFRNIEEGLHIGVLNTAAAKMITRKQN